MAGFIGKMATYSPKMSVTTNQILQCFHSKDNIVNSGTAFLIGNGVKCVQLVEDKEVKETVRLKLKGRPAVLNIP